MIPPPVTGTVAARLRGPPRARHATHVSGCSKTSSHSSSDLIDGTRREQTMSERNFFPGIWEKGGAKVDLMEWCRIHLLFSSGISDIVRWGRGEGSINEALVPSLVTHVSQPVTTNSSEGHFDERPCLPMELLTPTMAQSIFLFRTSRMSSPSAHSFPDYATCTHFNAYLISGNETTENISPTGMKLIVDLPGTSARHI
jgi:hypothetical protein